MTTMSDVPTVDTGRPSPHPSDRAPLVIAAFGAFLAFLDATLRAAPAALDALRPIPGVTRWESRP
mgnify:CR=1 FL=1